jgi:hypothetical protein
MRKWIFVYVKRNFGSVQDGVPDLYRHVRGTATATGGWGDVRCVVMTTEGTSRKEYNYPTIVFNC